METITPINEKDRIQSLDLLRGFAVLGILIMNIQSFSMISAAYINPSSFGDLNGINKWIWIISHIFADMKFMGLFSMLFGAGIALFSEKIMHKGLKPASLHYRRTFWLLIFGLIHSYLLWRGDILVTYAFCSFIIYLYRKMKPSTLLVLGIVSLVIGFILPLMSGLSMSFWPPESIEGILQTWRPSSEAIQSEILAYQENWLAALKLRIKSSFFMQTFLFFFEYGWRTGGMMLLGMAFYKWNIITAAKSTKQYIVMFIIGLSLSLPLIIFGVQKNFDAGWSLQYSMFQGALFNYWGSVLMAFAYMALIMIWSQYNIECILKKLLRNVGRMAFSNYILQTLICVFIFHSFGLGLYGQLERWQQALIIPFIWIINILFSYFWLNKYRFGPLEWVWRSLTYWKRQPMR